jgi:cyclophilin family peptidyl-prolyl cis-trans isomerase
MFVFSLILFINACTQQSNKATEKSQSSNLSEQKQDQGPDFTGLMNSVYTVQTYQGTRLLETGQGFVVGKNLLATQFNFFREADRAVLTPLNGGQSIIATKYTSSDRISNMIILYADSILSQPLQLYTDTFIKNVITFVAGKKESNTQPLYKGKCLFQKTIQGQNYFQLTNNVLNSQLGAPVFVSTGKILGMATFEEIANERNYFALPAVEIAAMIAKKESPKPLAAIGNPDSKRNASIQKIVLETDYGNIEIRLFNQTPTYRDNFVQLAKEGFFDHLLIHRVIRDFGIQSGAADTRNAAPDDIVGWKGPGYTLPAHFNQGLYHKRGAIGSPRKPDSKNKEKRSDGSQFYIVTGRLYLDNELDEIEKENGIKFTPVQRDVYKTVGGSPHLDGQYTVFGEVISGLEIADRITLLPTKNDFRPLNDIRLKRVRIIY